MAVSIPERNSALFREGLEALNRASVPYVIGGAFAVYHYAGSWRDTNDLDVYVERERVPDAAEALARQGFRDFGEMAAGDREWIYHAVNDGVLIDVIWQTPNHLGHIDGTIFERGAEGTFLGVSVRFIPADMLVWAKIFTMNHQRCDWPDLFAIVRACPAGIDWHILLEKMGENWPVLLSFIVLFDWAFPGENGCIPQELRDELLDRRSHYSPKPDEPTRESILDPWIYTRPLSP